MENISFRKLGYFTKASEIPRLFFGFYVIFREDLTKSGKSLVRIV